MKLMDRVVWVLSIYILCCTISHTQTHFTCEKLFAHRFYIQYQNNIALCCWWWWNAIYLCKINVESFSICSCNQWKRQRNSSSSSNSRNPFVFVCHFERHILVLSLTHSNTFNIWTNARVCNSKNIVEIDLKWTHSPTIMSDENLLLNFKFIIFMD